MKADIRIHTELRPLKITNSFFSISVICDDQECDMNWMRFSLSAVCVAAAFCPADAFAQRETRMQTGLRVAHSRGAPNPQCYARVFARHAVVVENASRERRWFAASTPAYNADMQRSCGVDRLALRSAQPVRSARLSPQGHTNAGAYNAGYRIAQRQGYSNPDCFARVFTRYASPMQSPARGIWYSYNAPAVMADARQSCGV
jgi:hypothetical protein